MDEEIKEELKAKKDQPGGSSCASADDKNKLAYCVTDAPPWYLCIVLSIQVCARGGGPVNVLVVDGRFRNDIYGSFPVQHYLTAFGAIFSIPLILSESLCLQHDGLTQSRLINTIFFVSGICTMLQVTFGVRSEEWHSTGHNWFQFGDRYEHISDEFGPRFYGSLHPDSK